MSAALFAEFGTGHVFWSWFTLLLFWIWTVITIVSDRGRRRGVEER